MKIFPQLRVADAKEMSRQGELAFTMVEIAIAIGVIGFALVAIIGILPTGMNVQKDNREDTLISQDAPYFLDALRNGVPVNNGNIVSPTNAGLDFLTNYVQSITFTYIVNGVVDTNLTVTFPNPTTTNWTGAVIVGLLSTPQTNYNSPYFATNYFDVTAQVRSLSGPATAQQNGTNLSSFMAFTYNMEVMISPFNSFAPATTNFALVTDPYQYNLCYNRFMEATPNALNAPVTLPSEPSVSLPLTPSSYPVYGLAAAGVFAGGVLPSSIPFGSGALTYNLFDVRLRFSWPVLQSGNIGPGRQTYRTMISGQLSRANVNGLICWFFQPQSFTNAAPSSL
jgi:type II secretory pathway pseudopilin PulG